MSVTLDFQVATEDESIPSEQAFQQWVDVALAAVKEDCELSIRLVDEAESAELNGQYRGKAGSTNVLSFPFDAEIELTPILLGDLIICTQVVKREAAEQGKPEASHWAHMVIHGCLHLLGYDHIETDEAQEMESLEIQLLQSMSIANPYELEEDSE